MKNRGKGVEVGGTLTGGNEQEENKVSWLGHIRAGTLDMWSGWRGLSGSSNIYH